MVAIFRNIVKACPVCLNELVPYRESRILSHAILNQPDISMVLYAMDRDEQISEETEPGMQWVTVLAGDLLITLPAGAQRLKAGQTILIPPLTPHALRAEAPCKTIQINIEGDTAMIKGTYIQKLPTSEVLALGDQIKYEPHKISSLSLVQRSNLIITLFALDAGEEMGGHASTGDAMVTVLEGVAEIIIGGEAFTVEAGKSLIMPANIQHGLKAVKAFKMLLTVVKP